MSQRKTLIGCDIGGTKSAIALYDGESLEELSQEKIATNPSRGFADVLESVLSLIEKYRSSDTVGIGVGLPGLIGQPQGIILRAPNIPGSENVAVKALLQKRLGAEVCIANDAACFALAEALLGAGKGHELVVGITLGTGVGGGIVMDGKLLQGAHGFAGEIGHMLLMPGQPPYPTKDNRGEIEQFLSGTALGHRCTAAKRPEEYLEGEVCSFLRPEIARETAWMITTITHMIDPDVIVLGGSTGRALKPLLPAIKKELDQWMLPGTPVPLLSIAERKDAGTLGAALLTRSL